LYVGCQRLGEFSFGLHRNEDMDPRKLLEKLERLSSLQRMEAEEFIRSLESRDKIASNGTAKDAIAQFLEHPVIVPDIKAPTREELYRER
jgi:hypothetical protein